MITLVGLGPGNQDLLTRAAEQALRAAAARSSPHHCPLLLRTARHPATDWLRAEGIAFATCDDLYESAPDFHVLYRQIAERVLAIAALDAAQSPPGDATYAVPGHPLLGERTSTHVLERAIQQQIAVRVVTSPCFIEAVLAAAGISAPDGLDVRDAADLQPPAALTEDGLDAGSSIDPSRPLLLFQVYSQQIAAQAKLALLEVYPAEWTVTLIAHAGEPGMERTTSCPLYRMDRLELDHLSTLYLPPIPAHQLPRTFSSLVGVMHRLRAPAGCPWDREQDHQSLKQYLVEEAYEVIDAIDSGDMAHLQEELGDLLLQVVFHSELASESGAFDIHDVINGIVAKLIRRHPHVFGEVRVSGSDDVLRNWERIKGEEKSSRPASALDGIPRALPALSRAVAIGKRAARTGFDWTSARGVLDKLHEEMQELQHEISGGAGQQRLEAEIGDVLFTVAQVARKVGVDPEQALNAMLGRFARRFQQMESIAGARGQAFEAIDAAEKEALWEQAKAADTPGLTDRPSPDR